MSMDNPLNGFVPRVGQRVKIIGACHPSQLGKEVEITRVDLVTKVFECKWIDEEGWLYSGGDLGGLIPLET